MKTESTNTCPKCGAPVPPEAPQGLCPQCVLAQAAAPELAATATANIPSIERLAAAFPQLQILELIGRGAMGFVFKARQPHLDRFVALKLLPDSLAQDPHFAERFNREGRTLARLNHPNIVSIFDFGQAGGFYYLLMEYVDGVNLRQAMQAGRFSPAEALAIVPKICEALQYAHEEGVLHRDIKPENILLDAKGRVKIADFGIAKIVGEEKPEAALTGTGAALGTPHYMAPEQLEKPGSVDHRADIYSLGVVFYEMLTGELPIGRFAAPSEKTPVDPRVDDVVMRTLEKEREKRFQSAGEVKTNVEHLTQAGAGSFKGVPPKLGDPASGRGPQPTIAIDTSDVVTPAPGWSWKGIIAAGLVGASLIGPLLLFIAVAAGGAGVSKAELLIIAVAMSLPGLAGTILGWMALSDIRAHQRRLRGLPLAVFGALAWPLLLVVGTALVFPYLILEQPTATGTELRASKFLMLIVPAGAITFAIWSIYAAAHWGANRPSTHRRGVLKWIFLTLLLFGVGALVLPMMRPVRQVHYVNAPEVAGANATPWIGFTVTAVELREEKGVRWLAIDYLDDVHGDCQKAFLRENSIPDFNSTTRSSEFVGGDTNAPVRHQRIEYRMPDSMTREQLETFRDEVAKSLNQKTFRLALGERQELFTLQGSAGGSLSAAITVVSQLTTPRVELLDAEDQQEYRRLQARAATLRDRVQELEQQFSPQNPVLQRAQQELREAKKNLQAMQKKPETTAPAQTGAIERRVALAQQQFDAMQQRVNTGVASQLELAEARRDLEVAEARGDAVSEARAKLKFAKYDLELARKRFEVGTISSAELRAAESREATAEIELEQAVSASSASARVKRADSKLVIDVWPGAYPAGVTPYTQPDHLRWLFKCLIPPNHFAQFLFVRWTNGVPSVEEGQSAYFRVGSAPAELTQTMSYDKLDPSRPASERIQWNVNFGQGFTVSTLRPEDPPYVPLDTQGRIFVQPRHQRSVPLVEFTDSNGARSRRFSGIDLRIILQPLDGPAIKTLPTETDRGHYISGGGLAGTMDETLSRLKELPADP